MEISDEMIALCAMNACLRTDGVADLCQRIGENISRNILGKDPMAKGIRVSRGEEAIVIDIYLIAEFGSKIPEVAWNVQENVKKEVEHTFEIPVSSVNIHVQGVQ